MKVVDEIVQLRNKESLEIAKRPGLFWYRFFYWFFSRK
jgi:hypothetical protein